VTQHNNPAPCGQPPHLLPWQWETAGLVFGAHSPVPVSEIEGLGSVQLRDQDTDNPVDDGALPGLDYYKPRTVRFEAGIKTPGDPATAAALLARLQRGVDDHQVRLAEGALGVLRGRWPGHRTRRLYGRLRRAEATSTANAIHGWIPLDIQFVAMDPHFHADHQARLALCLDQGRGQAVNGGDAAAWPWLRIHGPVTGPKLWNTATGQMLDFADTHLRKGEHLEVHTRPGTRWVLRNGTTNAADELTHTSRLDRFVIPPGRSEIQWSGHDPTDTCRLEIFWRSAYTTL